MLALTLHQPWASVVAAGLKNVENRSWTPPLDVVGERIAIHAGKTWDDNGEKFIREMIVTTPNMATALMIEQALRTAENTDSFIVATAVVAGCYSRDVHDLVFPSPRELTLVQREIAESPWFFGPWGWLLKDVQALDHPIRCRGFQKLWQIPDEQFARMKHRNPLHQIEGETS